MAASASDMAGAPEIRDGADPEAQAASDRWQHTMPRHQPVARRRAVVAASRTGCKGSILQSAKALTSSVSTMAGATCWSKCCVS